MFWSDPSLSQLFEPHVVCQKGLSWFSPSQQLSTMRLLAHSSPQSQWDGEQNRKKKVKLMGWDKDSLIGQ